MASTLELSGDHADFSNLLQSYVQSGSINFLIGSGASRPAIQTVGSIEKEINKLLGDNKKPEADLKALAFIEGIAEVNAAVNNGGASVDISSTMTAYKGFTTILDRILFERKNQLLPRQANIFTTNYDTFIEYASSQVPTLMLNDGFDRTAPITTQFSFAPERYFDRTYRSGLQYGHPSEVPTINLVKLHGSLSWRKKDDSLVYDSTPIPKLPDADKADLTKVEAQLRKYFLILPNLKKFDLAMMDRIYYDLLRLFANSMERENALLVSLGFSFDDEHILDITRRALRNPTAQLVIFCHNADTVARFESKFEKQRNALIVAPDAGSAIDLTALTRLLGTVLPA